MCISELFHPEVNEENSRESEDKLNSEEIKMEEIIKDNEYTENRIDKIGEFDKIEENSYGLRCFVGTRGCNVYCLAHGHRYGRCKHGKCHCY